MPSPQTSFAELSHRIRAGDRQAEDELSRRVAPGVTQVALKMTGNFAQAQELCQETLIVLLSRLRAEPLADPDKLPAFVAQVTRNLVMSERRKVRRRKTDVDSEAVGEAADDGPSQEQDVERESAAAAIRAVLGEMRSVRDRMLLVRYYLRDEDKREICKDFGLTEPSFNVVLFRARSRFLELLEKRGLRSGDLFSLIFL